MSRRAVIGHNSSNLCQQTLTGRRLTSLHHQNTPLAAQGPCFSFLCVFAFVYFSSNQMLATRALPPSFVGTFDLVYVSSLVGY